MDKKIVLEFSFSEFGLLSECVNYRLSSYIDSLDDKRKNRLMSDEYYYHLNKLANFLQFV